MSRIQSTLEGPMGVPDGRIDPSGLVFNAPLAALGQSLTATGQLGSRVANHYKKVHDTNVMQKAETEFQLRLDEAQARLETATSPEEFDALFTEENDAIVSLAEEIPGRVDSPRLKARLTNQMNLRSGRFAIGARRILFQREQAELRLGLDNDVNALLEQGDFAGAIRAVQETGPLVYSDEEVERRTEALLSERDSAAASIAVLEYQTSDNGAAPDLDSFKHLSPDERFSLRRAIASHEASRGGRDSALVLRRLQDHLQSMAASGSSVDEAEAVISEALLASGAEGDELAVASEEARLAFLHAQLGAHQLDADRSGSVESYEKFVQELESNPDYRHPELAGVVSQLLDRYRSLALTSSPITGQEQTFVDSARANMATFWNDFVSQGAFSGVGEDAPPTPQEMRQLLQDAAGFSAEGFVAPVIDEATGEVITEGSVSARAYNASRVLVEEYLASYQQMLSQIVPMGLSEAGDRRVPGGRVSQQSAVETELHRLGLAITEEMPQLTQGSYEPHIEAMARMMNKQNYAGSEILRTIIRTDMGNEARGVFLRNMSTLINSYGLSPESISQDLSPEQVERFYEELAVFDQTFASTGDAAEAASAAGAVGRADALASRITRAEKALEGVTLAPALEVLRRAGLEVDDEDLQASVRESLIERANFQVEASVSNFNPFTFMRTEGWNNNLLWSTHAPGFRDSTGAELSATDQQLIDDWSTLAAGHIDRRIKEAGMALNSMGPEQAAELINGAIRDASADIGMSVYNVGDPGAGNAARMTPWPAEQVYGVTPAEDRGFIQGVFRMGGLDESDAVALGEESRMHITDSILREITNQGIAAEFGEGDIDFRTLVQGMDRASFVDPVQRIQELYDSDSYKKAMRSVRVHLGFTSDASALAPGVRPFRDTRVWTDDELTSLANRISARLEDYARVARNLGLDPLENSSFHASRHPEARASEAHAASGLRSYIRTGDEEMMGYAVTFDRGDGEPITGPDGSAVSMEMRQVFYYQSSGYILEAARRELMFRRHGRWNDLERGIERRMDSDPSSPLSPLHGIPGRPRDGTMPRVPYI